jgi:hypothetical protein
MSFEEPYCLTSVRLPADLQNALDGVALLANATAARVAHIESETLRNGLLNFLSKNRWEIREDVGKVLPEIIAARRGRPVKVDGCYYPCAHDAVLLYAWHPGKLRNPDKLVAECKAESVLAAAARGVELSFMPRSRHEAVPPLALLMLGPLQTRAAEPYPQQKDPVPEQQMARKAKRPATPANGLKLRMIPTRRRRS